MSVVLPGVTALLAAVFALALLDQWRERRHGFQLIWGVGMVFFAIASGAEALGAVSGWSDGLYRTWYLTGAVFTAAWLGLGTALLLNRTRFGYMYGALVVFGGLLALVAARRYADAGDTGLLIMIGAVILGLAIAFETYFQNDRWPLIAGFAVAVGSLVAAVLAFSLPLVGGGFALDPQTGVPTGEAIAGPQRLISLVMNFSGGLALVLGALFSAYVFMPKRRLLDYSLDPNQKGDAFLFNLVIAVVAIPVNFVVSLPRAIASLVTGKLHSRVPATLLIATGGIVASSGDALSRLGSTDLFQVGKFVGVVLIFLGFLVSVEAFREIRVPFTRVVLRGGRSEPTDMASAEHPA